MEKEILNLDSSKACKDSDIPAKIIKYNSDIFTFLQSFCIQQTVRD